MELNDDICYRALQTHDARFDGQFFTAVVTTGVYCRSTCPAPTPKRENVRFFRHAAAAQEAGFRPCLRCRPELAPDLFASLGPSGVVARALRLIAEGALDEGSVAGLASGLGVTERHLRRLCVSQLGASPVAIAQNRRILFAKQLISQTDLSLAEIALAAGFGSIRRFNDVMQTTYARTPRELRRGREEAPARDPGAPITLSLGFNPPYDWPALVEFLAKRAIPGVESVSTTRYSRTIEIDGSHGFVHVSPAHDGCALHVSISFPKIAALGQIVERLRGMFDLHTNIHVIAEQFAADPVLGPLVALRPGVRVPGAWDPFELAVRAILGQQVSVGAATTLAGRLVAAFGTTLPHDQQTNHSLSHVFPAPARLAEADLTTIGLPKARASAITQLAATVAAQPTLLTSYRDLDDVIGRLTALPGIGPWTAHYIAMRALREPDAFPAHDLGLRHGFARNGGSDSAAALLEAAEAWRPWRAYAAMHLWM